MNDELPPPFPPTAPPPPPEDEELDDDVDASGEEEDVAIGADYIGTVLDDRYLIQEIIGQGGMGTVFRAEQTLMQKQVAIKLLHASLAARKQVVGRFTREARAISRLNSPHTIRVYDFGRWRDLFFLVMELLEGETLDAVLANGPMPYRRVVEVVIQMCDSLGEAHAAGVVHRDLKPENVFLMRQTSGGDFVKILDFGLAKLKNSEDLYDVHSKAELFGTPHYMSPEQIRAGEVDGRSDVYSVGALMFRMLTGEYLFADAQATFDVLKAHLSTPVPQLATIAPKGTEIPQALQAIVEKCLAKKPEARFQSMAELATALQNADWHARTQLPEPDLPEVAVESLARKTTQQRILAFGAVLMVLAGGAAAVLSSRNEPVAGVELEPNDDARHPGALGPDGVVVGSVGKRRSATQADLDCYALPKLTPGQQYQVQVTGLPNMDLQVALHDKDGDTRLTVDHRGRGQGELLRFADPKLPVQTVCVTEAVAANGTASESLSDQYTLRVQTVARDPGSEQEPNDQAPGEELPVESPRAGSLEGPKDRDVYRLQGAVDGRLVWVTLQLPENPPVGTQFALLDQAGRVVASRALKPGERDAALGLVPADDQIPDRLVVYRQGQKDVPLSADEAPYRVEVSHRPVNVFPEVEPNDAPDQANPLSIGAWQAGSCQDGADWLRLDGGDPSLARIRVEAQAVGTAPVQVTVRDVGQQVDVRTMVVQPGQPQDFVVAGSGDGVLVKVAAAGKGDAKWQVWLRYLRGVVSGK